MTSAQSPNRRNPGVAKSPNPGSPPEPLLSRAVALARDIKLSHSVFALPFALLATFLAAAARPAPGFNPRHWTLDTGHWPPGVLPSWPELSLIVLCMVLARTVAMTVNRLVDAGLDRNNPRTAERAIPSGRLTRAFVAAVAAVCAAGFIAATAGFWWLSRNPWPLFLAPVALAWLALYSFAKRFTWLCHLWLGSALAMSPLAATLALNPAYLSRPEPYLLAGMVLCWVGGFDIIYALQDVAIDRRDGLFSMPARLGIEPALWVARLLHLAALTALIALAWMCPVLHLGFALGVAAAGILLAVEHALVWGSKTHHINVAFFTVNGVISLLLGGLGILDIFIG
jgi:4-hydroxybenzoate polyprenyltransferase